MAEVKKIATRESYGNALAECGDRPDHYRRYCSDSNPEPAQCKETGCQADGILRRGCIV